MQPPVEHSLIAVHAIMFGTGRQRLERFLERELKSLFASSLEIDARVHVSHYEKIQDAYDETRRQIASGPYLRFLDSFDPNDTLSLNLGIIDEDLFSDSYRALNFIFGEARVGGKSCVISIARLDPRFYQLPFNENLFNQRTLKEAVHELGHVIGVEHCDDVQCIMHFSNCIEDTDIKHMQPCARCGKIMKKKVKNRESLTRGRES